MIANWQLIGLSILGAMAVTVVLAAASRDRVRQPDYAEMRAHRIAQLSDDDLRRFRRESEEAYLRDNINRESERQAAHQLRLEMRERCRDIVFLERNRSDCYEPTLESAPNLPDSPLIRYERMVMGSCVFMRSVHEAQRSGCLP